MNFFTRMFLEISSGVWFHAQKSQPPSKSRSSSLDVIDLVERHCAKYRPKFVVNKIHMTNSKKLLANVIYQRVSLM